MSRTSDSRFFCAASGVKNNTYSGRRAVKLGSVGQINDVLSQNPLCGFQSGYHRVAPRLAIRNHLSNGQHLMKATEWTFVRLNAKKTIHCQFVATSQHVTGNTKSGQHILREPSG